MQNVADVREQKECENNKFWRMGHTFSY